MKDIPFVRVIGSVSRCEFLDPVRYSSMHRSPSHTSSALLNMYTSDLKIDFKKNSF